MDIDLYIMALSKEEKFSQRHEGETLYIPNLHPFQWGVSRNQILHCYNSCLETNGSPYIEHRWLSP